MDNGTIDRRVHLQQLAARSIVQHPLHAAHGCNISILSAEAALSVTHVLTWSQHQARVPDVLAARGDAQHPMSCYDLLHT